MRTPMHGQDPELLIGICTFRRPELARALESLARLRSCGMTVGIAIADNDTTPSAQALVARIAASHPLPITYLHAPERNISIARNALLDHARATGARLHVSFDDDQTAEPEWLEQTVQTWREGQRDPAGPFGVVLGPVRAMYQPGSPRWLERGGLHDTLPVTDRKGTIISGYTGNTLFDMADPALQGLRFDVARGRTGGEDTAFFSDYLAAGGRIAFAPGAVVHEVVPQDRASLKWLLKRRYRMGQTHASLVARGRSRAGRLRAAGIAAAKAAACGGMALVGAGDPVRRNRQLMRAALHVGAGAYLAGAPRIELYGTAPEGAKPAASIAADGIGPNGMGPKGT